MAAKSKDELIAEAEARGIEVHPDDTKIEIEDKLAAADQQSLDEPGAEQQDAEAETNVVDDGVEDTDGPAPVPGSWVDLTTGEKAGTHAAYVETLEEDDEGNPVSILVRTRDPDNELLTVAYADVKGTVYSGGR